MTQPAMLAAILVAAGSGTRFGTSHRAPKQFLPLAGRAVIRHAAEALAAAGALIQPVGDAAAIGAALDGIPHLPPVPGGATRQASVHAGLEALAPLGPALVLVHDAARPFIPPGTIPALLAAREDAAGAIPALPVAATRTRGAEGRVRETVSRQGLFRAQTPQAFRFPVLLAAHRAAARLAEPEATDDAAILEAAGEAVALVAGHDDNVKITWPEDLARMERTLGPAALIPRIGSGFDVHAFAPDRKLILCGIVVLHSVGLAGHSDADVGLHALCDAIYGALAEGDIGRHFPPSDQEWKDADSARFVRHAAGRIVARGGVLANADLTLICERPKITPHAPAMITRSAELRGVAPERISVKATTTERLGFTGRGEGIAAQASVLLLLPG